MVDLSFLEKFTKGNDTKMKRYISMYLNMAPETHERMRQNIEDRSWTELAVNAHSLKPQADYMGIATLKELMVEIENKVKSNQVDDMEILYKEAISIHKESEAFLNDYIKEV
jgi:HPt (histidine-containing phosphotransfer) domain-containing protein